MLTIINNDIQSIYSYIFPFLITTCFFVTLLAQEFYPAEILTDGQFLGPLILSVNAYTPTVTSIRIGVGVIKCGMSTFNASTLAWINSGTMTGYEQVSSYNTCKEISTKLEPFYNNLLHLLRTMNVRQELLYVDPRITMDLDAIAQQSEHIRVIGNNLVAMMRTIEPMVIQNYPHYMILPTQ